MSEVQSLYEDGQSQDALWNAWSVVREESKKRGSRSLSICIQKVEEAIMWYERSPGHIDRPDPIAADFKPATGEPPTILGDDVVS